MSSSKKRQDLIDQIHQQVKDQGNLNVLLVNAIAQRVGLSAPEFECASLIREHGPFTAGELARRCQITTGGMTGMIDRLERAGVVRRTADPHDRRRVIVEAVPSPERRKKIVALYGPLSRDFTALLNTYTDEQLLFLAEFMSTVTAMFGKAIDSLPPKEL